MVPGIHATTLAFVGFDQVLTLIRKPGWPWFGSQALAATGRRIGLKGGPPRVFILRPLSVKVATQLATCRVQLESVDGPAGEGLLTGEMTFERGAAREATKVALSASAARALAGTGLSPATGGVRDIANAYARSLIEAVAAALEGATTKSIRTRKGSASDPERRAPNLRLKPQPKCSPWTN